MANTREEVQDKKDRIELKILKGTIVKVDGHPVKIQHSFYVKGSEDDFSIAEQDYLIDD